jgi:hypothetical protein
MPQLKIISKKRFEGFLQWSHKVISLQSVKNVTKSLFDPQLIYESTFTMPDVLKRVGNIRIVDIPFIDKAYSRDTSFRQRQETMIFATTTMKFMMLMIPKLS